jgi:hypothetical protein
MCGGWERSLLAVSSYSYDADLVDVLLAAATALALCAGCMSRDSGSAAQSPKPAVHTGVLVVHVGAFGGPLRRDGRMGASNAPESDAPVSAMAATGRTWTATTGRDGIAAGRSRLVSTGCRPLSAVHRNASRSWPVNVPMCRSLASFRSVDYIAGVRQPAAS